MNTIVIKLGKNDLQNLVKTLASKQITNNNPYVTFAAKINGVTVLAYTSGKVVFQGSSAEEVASQFGYKASESAEKSSQAGQNMPLIGSDEVGNGSYFGGLAVVASFVTPDDHALLKKLGVDDSKNLTDSKIRQIAPILEKNIKHKALLLSP
ncbi:DUF3378 domain-containing protein, partial [Streptococcus sp.]|uniref:DUF3378 domain-containing protein n=1 Tax=Streptococcus sp. TaxID=1306 RepID=UPI001842809B